MQKELVYDNIAASDWANNGCKLRFLSNYSELCKRRKEFSNSDISIYPGAIEWDDNYHFSDELMKNLQVMDVRGAIILETRI